MFPSYLGKCVLVFFSWSLDIFHSGTNPGVHHVSPVLDRVAREVPPSLDYQDAGVTHLSRARFGELETLGEMVLVLLTAGEPRRAALGPANATPVLRSVELRLVEGCHFAAGNGRCLVKKLDCQDLRGRDRGGGVLLNKISNITPRLLYLNLPKLSV